VTGVFPARHAAPTTKPADHRRGAEAKACDRAVPECGDGKRFLMMKEAKPQPRTNQHSLKLI
jgi:hypothetical protein